MRYLSLFSGVEAATLAWEPLGWKPEAFAEFDAFPSAVLAHHYPDVPNLGDVTKIEGSRYRGTVELIVGGSPCQGFSVAGRQKGLDDPRSGLALAYVRLLAEVRPKWFVWENVPGVLATNGGKDFKEFLSEITELGYHCAWRILDAQNVRVDGYPGAIPQRRRRLFVVGHLTDWRYPAEVLFEQESLRRDSEKSGEEREAASGAAEKVARGADKEVRSGRAVTLKIRSGCEGGGKGALWQVEKSATLATNNDQTLFQPNTGAEADASATQQTVSGVCAYGLDRAAFNQGKNAKFGFSVCEEVRPTLTSKDPGAVCSGQVFDMTHANDVIRECGDKVPTLQARMGTGGNQVPLVMQSCYPINMSNALRKSSNGAGGLGVGDDGDPMFTLTTTSEKRAVALYNTALTYGSVKEGDVCKTLAAHMDNQTDLPLVLMDQGGSVMNVEAGKTGTLRAQTHGHEPIVCHAENSRTSENTSGEVMRVRRLTPIECERLMGFPDDYTKVPYRGKSADDCPDAPRYKACGNSMCVNVMRWIGQRIQECEDRHGGT